MDSQCIRPGAVKYELVITCPQGVSTVLHPGRQSGDIKDGMWNLCCLFCKQETFWNSEKGKPLPTRVIMDLAGPSANVLEQAGTRYEQRKGNMGKL